MKYNKIQKLRDDALAVADPFQSVPQSQESLNQQLADLSIIAGAFGLYDADDFIQRAVVERLSR